MKEASTSLLASNLEAFDDKKESRLLKEAFWGKYTSTEPAEPRRPVATAAVLASVHGTQPSSNRKWAVYIGAAFDQNGDLQA